MHYLITFTILICSYLTVVCQDAQRLLTDAVYTEEVQGDLGQAIDQYTEIIKSYPGDRAIVAQTLLRLGIAHEKLGKMQARSYYEQIVSKYPDQTQQVSIARKRLAGLVSEISNVSSASESRFITQTKLAELPDIYGQVSSDGRYISYVNWEHGNLALYEIHSGKSTEITDEGTWEGTSAFADMSVWSPDNSQIAYTWYSGQNAEFRIYDLATKQSRLLIPQRGNLAPFPFQWTDQGFILMQYSDKKHVCEALYLVDAETGVMHTVRSFGAGDHIPGLRGASVSPDGQYLALTLKYEGKPLETHVYSMNHPVGPPLSILTQTDSYAVWSADGMYVYYTDTRHENKALYKRRVTKGILSAQDETILESVGNCGLSNVNPESGDLYYLGGAVNSMIFRAEIDWVNRKFKAHDIVLSSDMSRWGPALSPDGKQFAYCKRGTKEIQGNHICIRQLDTGIERDYNLRLRNVEQPLGHTQLQWTPDGRYVAVTYAPLDESGQIQHRLAFVEVKSGAVREIPDLHVYRHCKVILSENQLVKHDRGLGLSIVDLRNGETPLVYSMPDSLVEAWFLSRSHNGRKIAFIEGFDNDDFLGHSLKLLDLDSKQVQELWQPARPLRFAYRQMPAWLPGDRGLMVMLQDQEAETQQFYTYDLATGKYEPFDEPTDRKKLRRFHATLSPDGNMLLYAREDRVSTAWEVKNINSAN